MFFIKLLKSKPRRRHRVAHPTAHRTEPCEICWIVTKVLRSEDVRDDDVVEKARDGRLRGGSAHIGRDITTHESIGVVWRVGRHRGGFVCASLSVVATHKSVNIWVRRSRLTCYFYCNAPVHQRIPGHTTTHRMASLAAMPAISSSPRYALRVPNTRSRSGQPRGRAFHHVVRATSGADNKTAPRGPIGRKLLNVSAAVAMAVAVTSTPTAAQAKLVNIVIDNDTLTTQLCADPRAGGVPGSATYKAKCMEIVGTALNNSKDTVYNADVYGSIKDQANDDVLNSGRVGSIPELKPGSNEFRLQLTVAASQPLPLKLKNFKASGVTTVLNASPNPYDDYTEFDDFGAQK